MNAPATRRATRHGTRSNGLMSRMLQKLAARHRSRSRGYRLPQVEATIALTCPADPSPDRRNRDQAQDRGYAPGRLN